MHVYELLTIAHRFYNKRIIGEKRLPGWTISVGNWTWGGSGKTPLCAWLATQLGKDSCAILSRGYKGGDEANMLQKKGFLVGVGKDRFTAARKLLETHSGGAIKYWILDDGLQHWALKRDLEIICVDCLQPFGINGKLIPFGSLREMPLEALKRADIVVLHNCDLIDEKRLNELDSFVRSALVSNQVKSPPIVHSTVRFASNLTETLGTENADWVLFSGLGDNDAFFKSATNLSARCSRKVIKTVPFPDHHFYSSSDLFERIKVNSECEKLIYLTTEKDIARCPFLTDRPLLALALPIEWSPIGGDLEAFEFVLGQIAN